MAISDPYAPRAEITGRRHRRLGLLGGGTAGNEQLTAAAGVLLLVLFAVLGITILRIGQLLWLHLFLGVLLAGPVALKLASTGYRFARYYTADPAYKRKGPPHPILRGLAPLVVLATLAVFATGLALLLVGPSASPTLRLLHKLSFFLWVAVTAVHVLGHLLELPRSLRAVSHANRGRSRRRPGSGGRALALIVALLAGVVVSLALLPRQHDWTRVGAQGDRQAQIASVPER